MNVDRPSLDAAVTRSILTANQADELWQFLKHSGKDTPGFRVAHVLYYLGGVVAIAAMTLFMTKGWERFGGTGIFTIAVVYLIFALVLTTYLQRRGHPVPATACCFRLRCRSSDSASSGSESCGRSARTRSRSGCGRFCPAICAN